MCLFLNANKFLNKKVITKNISDDLFYVCKFEAKLSVQLVFGLMYLSRFLNKQSTFLYQNY
jgi:hypothetical protein